MEGRYEGNSRREREYVRICKVHRIGKAVASGSQSEFWKRLVLAILDAVPLSGPR